MPCLVQLKNNEQCTKSFSKDDIANQSFAVLDQQIELEKLQGKVYRQDDSDANPPDLGGQLVASPIENESSHSSASTKSVRFDKIRVRTHQLCLGVNPSVSKGPPTELAWDHIASESFCLDDFEESQHSDGEYHRPQRLSFDTRSDLLLENGHSHDSFERVEEEILEIKMSRQQEALEAKRCRRQEIEEMLEKMKIDEYKLILETSLGANRKAKRALRERTATTEPSTFEKKSTKKISKRHGLFLGWRKGKSRNEAQHRGKHAQRI